MRMMRMKRNRRARDSMMTMIDLMFAVRLWDYNDYFCGVFFFDK